MLRFKPFPFAIIISIIFAIIGTYYNVSKDILFLSEAIIWSSYFIVSRNACH